MRGVESVTFFSDEELRAAGEDATLLRHPHYVKASPILDAHDQFDEAFFGYSPREARLMDPQQRLFLEVAWETFEDAGYDPLGEKGRVGVFAGAGGLVSSYMVRLAHPELRGQTGDVGHIGNDRDFLCSRVSFKLNLTGPSVNVQTACSTSLVALHLACRALVDGEADMALAGASVVRVPHVRGYLAEPGNIYSVDGHCRAFDARASGTLFGSGVAAVLLKPLGAALADGDRVYAVIKGSAVNNDGGQKVNYTASTATGQSRAMIEAMAIADVGGDDIDFVECHGTATALGDPLEIQALTRAFRTSTSRVGTCAIGSVKSNFGHLEQCAGMAGLVKAVLALRHGIVPPSLHFQTPNPRILFDRSPFHVLTSARPLGSAGRPRRAGVNSVGMGGTNAFLVLEESPLTPARPSRSRPLSILTVSAPSAETLAAQVGRIRAVLTAAPPAPLPDVCFTANRGRHHFGWRFAAVGGDSREMLAALDRFAGAKAAPLDAVRRGAGEPVVFLFPGQGSQYPRMGEAIYRTEPTFRDALDRCWALFAAAGIPVADAVLADDPARLQQTLYAQPALFSLQVALTELWKHWGVTPGAVIGHSIGEFAAAVAAGVCSVEDAATLVTSRAQLMETLSARGAMLAVAGDARVLEDVWPQGRRDLTVAAENAPDRLVISGDATAVAIVAQRLRQRGVSATALNVSHAFHSPLMDPILDAYEALIEPVHFAAPEVPWVSTLTGQEMTRAPDTRYWRDQIRAPVRFRAAIETAARSNAVFLELGPGATLINLGSRCTKPGDSTGPITWAASLMKDPGEWASLLDAVRALYLRGHAIGWEAFESGQGRRVGLPTYPFRHRRWWLESRHLERAVAPVADARTRGTHPLLGERLGEGGLRFETLLDLERQAFLADHRVFGRAVFPTAAVLEIVVAAARRVLGFSQPVVADLVYELALVIPADRPIWLHLALQPSGGRATFRVESTGIDDGDPWQVNVTGTVRDEVENVALPPFPSSVVRSDVGAIPAGRFYRFLAARGLSYGPAFQGITRLWRHDDQAFARVALPDELPTSDYVLHPALLDACLHIYAALPRKYGRFDPEEMTERRAYVPIGVGAFHVLRSAVRTAWVQASVVERDAEDESRLRLDIAVYADDGDPVAVFRDVIVRETGDEMLGTIPESLPQRLYRVTWRDVGHPQPAASLPKHWFILADSTGIGEHLARLLNAEGCTVDVVTTAALSAIDGSDVTSGEVFETLLGQPPDDPVGVVYLWALDVPVSEVTDAGPPPGAYTLAGGACVGLLKALDQRRPRSGTRPRLWLVTRGAQMAAAERSPNGRAQSPLWGLGRTVALEAPDLWGGLIDLPPDIGAEPAAELLLGELKHRDGEDQIVLRGSRRFAARFVRMSPPTLPARHQPKGDASYWIVGGLGRIGLKTAEALVDAGARHLVLTGRHASESESAGPLQRLRSQADVVVRASDVSSEADVEEVLAYIGQRMPPLKGVIYAAAVFDDAVLVKLDWEQWRRVLNSKMTGAWVLSRATREVKLDFFVLFSSVLSVWGGLGQAAYTAANSFIDSLAEFRRCAELPATVFNWGPWADVGLAERWGPAGTALWTQRGTSALAPDVYIEALLRFLDGDASQVVVCETRWEDFLAQFPQTPPLFREIAAVSPPKPGREGREGPEPLLEVVRRHVGHVLGVDDTISVTQPLNQLGLDSLLAVSLANRLRDALKVSVPTALLLKGPSITGLLAELFPDAPVSTAACDDHQAVAAPTAGGGWLIFHHPNPRATMRLFCFPFAGGGAATFRSWTQRLDPSIELVAIEPPGRQTRIEEAPIRELATFVEQLVDVLRPFLDKPFAVYGHCLGALTLFETVHALISRYGLAPVHVFVSGARTPDELHRPQEFETKLLERLLKLPGYNVFEPIYRQPDDVFAEAILQFNVVATESLLGDAELRRLILPVIRADFEMSSNYRYASREPWDIPITCLTGTHDAYVSPANARAWGRFTRRQLQLFMVETEHFLVVDDNEFVIQVLNRELGRLG
jgi:acyl transferase domain-containing protein/surfactin synthase thioesterase subunit/acyl carrier protein